MRLSHKFLMILCLSGTALSLPAQAQDVPPVVAAMLASIERGTQIKPTYDEIEMDGEGAVTISKLTLSKPADGDKPSVTVRIDEMTLEDIEDEGDGLFRVGNAEITNINGDVSGPDGAVTFALPESRAEGLYIQAPGDAAGNSRLMMTLANKLTAGKMTWAMMGQSVTVDAYEQTWDGDPKTGAGTYEMKVTNIAVPEEALAAVDQGGMLKQLGYSGLNIDLTSSGKMEVNGGNYGGDMSFGITSRNMGTFSFGLSASGIPQAMLAELQKAGEENREPDMQALMPQIQSISIGGATFRFEDASITKKLLPMLAAMQGMDEATLVNMAGPMLQMTLMQLQNQAFAEQATKAVDGFLKDPKSITVSAKPATPVTIAEFMGMNPGSPGEIITRLGVGVSAND